MNNCMMCEEYAFRCPYYDDWENKCTYNGWGCYMENEEFDDDDDDE